MKCSYQALRCSAERNLSESVRQGPPCPQGAINPCSPIPGIKYLWGQGCGKKWIRQSPFLWRQESLVWSLSCKSWLYRLPILSQGSVVQDALLLHPWALSWSYWHIIFLGIHKSPFLTQWYIHSWLPVACPATALLLPTIASQSLYFTTVSPSPAGLSSPADRTWPIAFYLLTLHICSVLTHLQIRAREASPDSSCLRSTWARLDTWPSHLESRNWKFKLEKSNLLGQMQHWLSYELWKVF